MRKLILSLLVVVSLGACTQNEGIGRYQYSTDSESGNGRVFDTKTGELFFFDNGWRYVLDYPKGTIREVNMDAKTHLNDEDN
jgi:hypothetical protein